MMRRLFAFGCIAAVACAKQATESSDEAALDALLEESEESTVRSPQDYAKDMQDSILKKDKETLKKVLKDEIQHIGQPGLKKSLLQLSKAGYNPMEVQKWLYAKGAAVPLTKAEKAALLQQEVVPKRGVGVAPPKKEIPALPAIKGFDSLEVVAEHKQLQQALKRQASLIEKLESEIHQEQAERKQIHEENSKYKKMLLDEASAIKTLESKEEADTKTEEAFDKEEEKRVSKVEADNQKFNKALRGAAKRLLSLESNIQDHALEYVTKHLGAKAPPPQTAEQAGQVIRHQKVPVVVGAW
eukprot:TRINITY_DN40560_c0_g1_i1.p1 TRINITY_DN40560_c0_g1~~TRINITY_DN40560_c0_g1_i1.p1  ORF type:complete len:299 (+),score=111.98 TRINITY_DN40560_c0_g1_i1:94-990(+)